MSKLTDPSKRIADLSPAKLELLARRLKERAADRSQPQQIRRRSATNEAAPLSFAQERLWFIAQFEDEAATHNATSALRLAGPLKVPVFEQALAEITRRHESLRTNFKLIEGGPMQFVSAPTPFRLTLIDLSALTAAGQGAEIRRLTASEARREFNLATDPLLRTCLLRLSPHQHVVTQSAHHIVCDGWSSRILIRELATLYDAFARGRPSSLAELNLQYADFAQWQREWLSGEVFEEHLSYWRRQLAGLPPVLELPTDRPRPAVRSTRGESQRFTLPGSLTAALKELSQERKATLFMTMLAAWQTLLYRYSGQFDISIGIPTGGRSRLETEGLIGLFGNTLVLRGDLSGNPAFEELLRRTRQVALDAFTHQQMPFERLVTELRPERSLSHTPLFQVMFDLQKAGPAVNEMAGVGLEPLGIEGKVAEFDLTLAMRDEGERLIGLLDYSVELYDAATIQRMVRHYRRILEAIVTNPRQRLSELPLLTSEEEKLLLVEWNDTAGPYSYRRCIHELFEEQVERTPDVIALMHEEQHLSYAELNRRANQVAHRLRREGVGPEDFVGLCFERSVEMMVGMLGVLKVGGAYLSLDPTYPVERLSHMLEDSGAMLLLTSRRLLENLPPNRAVTVICLDTGWDLISAEPSGNPVGAASSGNLAYVIYTSGSTGKPKGVAIQHDSLVNYIEGANVWYGMGTDDRMLQFASIGFDVSAEEIFIALTRGATLVLRTDAMVAATSIFLRQLKDWQITAMELPTAYWHQLTTPEATEDWAIVDQLRFIIIGGESVRPERVAAWQKATNGRVQMFNACGPTEITIGATLFDVPAMNEKVLMSEVPIGYPIHNYQCYVLDTGLRPVMIGVAAEMYVGGVGLARGYLNGPALTAEKFVPHPFSSQPGARLYRTGDWVRFLSHGEIELIQRIDRQTKIRGFRVELGEVEDALRRHPSVRDSVVLVRDHHTGDKRLVTYLVLVSEAELHTEDLRRHLRTTLPEYMIPSAFVTLAALPLTANNKIDRAALPAPDETHTAVEQSYVGPQTEVERVVARIWEAVLGVERVGIHCNFFDLAGHSLLMVQVQSRLRKELQREVSMLDLFRYPTVSELVKHLRQSEADQIHGEAVEEQPEERVRAGKDRLRQQLRQRRQSSAGRQ